MRAPAARESNRSSLARRYSTGIEIAFRSDDTLTLNALAALERSTSDLTARSELCSSDSSCRVTQCPSSHHDNSARGNERTGAIWVSEASGDSQGRGLWENVVERTKPIKPGGRLAAIASAMGPENDCPSRASLSAESFALELQVPRSQELDPTDTRPR